jgi:predicted transposase YbfD/YdcC
MWSLEMASKKQESVDELVSKSLWAAGTLVDHLGAVEDPRGRQGRLHVFTDILAILVLGTVCGCDDAEELEDWASKEKDWLSTFLQLPHGIPSQDTYLRALSSMNPDQFRMVFHGWVKELFQALGIPGQVAVDGKTIRGSRRKTTDKSVVHMVSALCCESGLVCGQIRTGEKTNEIGVFPELLSLLDLKGTLVSMDAMGCQVEVAEQIVASGGDYLFGLKGNQPTLLDETRCAFEEALDVRRRAIEETAPPQLETNEHVDGGHGRVETRRVSVCHDFRDWVPSGERFIGLNTLIQVESRVEKKNGNQILEETRYYVSSRKMTAVAAQEAVRNHWHVENRLHWVLDMTFSEDHCRTRTEHAAENLSVIRHFAINVLRNYQGDRHSLRRRRRLCNYKRDYRYLVLSAAAMS